MASESETDKLICLVQSRPALYNYKLRDYNNRSIVDNLWQEVADEMQWDVATSKIKWTSLRNSYARVLRNQKTRKGKRMKGWYLEDSMSFMEKFMKKHMKKHAEDNPMPERSVSITKKLYNNKSNNNSFQENSPQIQIPIETLKAQTKNPIQMIPENRNRVPESMVPFLEIRTAENENPNLLFFKGLLPDLDKLPSEKQRAFKRYTFEKLMELIDSEEYEIAGKRQNAHLMPSSSSSNIDDRCNLKNEQMCDDDEDD